MIVWGSASLDGPGAALSGASAARLGLKGFEPRAPARGRVRRTGIVVEGMFHQNMDFVKSTLQVQNK